MNLSTVPPSARNASVSAAKWRDVWRIKLSGSAISAMPVKSVTSVNRIVTSCLAPPSTVEIELSMIPLTISFGTQRAKDQILRGPPAIFVANATLRAVAAIPSPHSCADQPALDIPDLGDLGVRGMRHRVADQPGELGMRDQHTERVEDYGRSVLSGASRVDKIAELIELEVGGDYTAYLPLQRCAHGDHRCAYAERSIGRRNESPVRLHCVA